MTNRQGDKARMYLTVIDYLKKYTTITGKLPNFAPNIAVLESALPNIQNLAVAQQSSRTGITKGLKQLSSTLAISAADVARKLTAYATFSNNLTLLDEIDISPSKFIRFPNADLGVYSQLVYDRAQDNIKSLAAYGITAASQQAFLGEINIFTSALANPRIGTVDAGQATRQLTSLFQECDVALNNITLVIEIVKLTQPEFYDGFQNARKFIATGTNSISLAATVVEASTNAPVSNVKFTFNQVESPAYASVDQANPVTIIKKTASKGKFVIKSMPEGAYNVKVSKPNYRENFLSVNIINGELSSLNVQLEKAS